MGMRSTNPATGEVFAEFANHTAAEVEAIVAAAHEAQATWRTVPLTEREHCLQRLAVLLEEEAESLARLATLEMGKPIAEAIGEVRKCAWVCRYYAESATELLRPRAIATEATDSYVRYDPLGVILAVMPWNFPFWQVFRFLAPTLMAGNAGLLKHAPNVPQCAQAVECLARQAGFPAALFRALFVDVNTVGPLIADPRIAGATLTGSEAAGQAVGAAAGAAIKPVVLELGGSDPFIVLADADLAKAVTAAVASRCLNSGQSCIAAKRFIVVADVYDTFVEQMATGLSALRVGDPLAPETQIGPLAAPRFRDTLHGQVQRLIAEGATLQLGGTILAGPGCFYPPTLLTAVPHGSATAREEVFGPVACVFRVANTEEAITLANHTAFGLGASLWTRSRATADALIPRLDAGAVFVNSMVKSDPRLPFGGTKRSGVGRELSREGILAFMNAKTVTIET